MLNRIKVFIKSRSEMRRAIKKFRQNYLIYLSNGRVDISFENLLRENSLILQKGRIVSYFQKNREGYKQFSYELDCLKKSLPYLMTCDTEDYREKCKTIQKEIKTISFDKEKKLFFLIRNGKRLYLKRDMDSYTKVAEYYEYLAYEQTENSPHLYTDDSFFVDDNSVLVDCGAAEGIFGLDNIERVKHLYIFECDKAWGEALRATFEPYCEKVTIVEKYVSDIEDFENITLDSYFKNREINFIKMDVEGAEEAILRGAKEIITSRERIKMAIAAYHKPEAERNIVGLLPGFRIEKSRGFLLHAWEIAPPPFFRTGVIRATK